MASKTDQTRAGSKRAVKRQQGQALAATLCAATVGVNGWSGDEGREHRAFLNGCLDLAVSDAIRARDWSRARLLASALNLGA